MCKALPPEGKKTLSKLILGDILHQNVDLFWCRTLEGVVHILHPEGYILFITSLHMLICQT